MPDVSMDLHKQARAVSQVRDIFRQNARRLDFRGGEVDHLDKLLSDASDSLALAAGTKEASRIIGEFRPS